MSDLDFWYFLDDSGRICDPRAPAGGPGIGRFNLPGPIGINPATPDACCLNPQAPATLINGCLLRSRTIPSGQEPAWEETLADFERWEGKIAHMYLDTRGYVTVGIGNMLANAATAKKLAFVVRETGLAATPAQIEADFVAVNKLAAGKPAASYKTHTQLDLPEASINELLKVRIDVFRADLAGSFKGYATYPVAAKRALLDMIYDLGKGGLLNFKKLKAAAESGKWKEAATYCHRQGPSKERNDWTRELFLEAAR